MFQELYFSFAVFYLCTMNDRRLKEVNKHDRDTIRCSGEDRSWPIVGRSWRHSGETKTKKGRNNHRRSESIRDYRYPWKNKKPLVVDWLFGRARDSTCSKINSAIKPRYLVLLYFPFVRSCLRLIIRGVVRERVHFYVRVLTSIAGIVVWIVFQMERYREWFAVTSKVR